jgi:hypothetical protein
LLFRFLPFQIVQIGTAVATLDLFQMKPRVIMQVRLHDTEQIIAKLLSGQAAQSVTPPHFAQAVHAGFAKTGGGYQTFTEHFIGSQLLLDGC